MIGATMTTKHYTADGKWIFVYVDDYLVAIVRR
jgi:hypothetical protein